MSDVLSSDDWPAMVRDVRFTDGIVQVWRVALDRPEDEVAQARTLLSDDELQRADRFRVPKPRRQFIVCRSVLRSILGEGLGVDPRAIRFEYGVHGKPHLAGPVAFRHLQFNVSHSGELALIAVAADRRLGIDLEFIRPDLRYLPLARRFFSPRETAALQQVQAERQREAFFHCWTRKEAYIKAEERGLSLPLDRFDVSLRPDEPARLLQSLDDPTAADRWWMVALQPGENYAGALIAEGREWELRCWEWVSRSATKL